MLLASTPSPPYYAVIFASVKGEDLSGYSELSERMKRLASEQEGFLGIDSARAEIGITVSYWKDMESINKWKVNIEHLKAKKLGREKWYSHYTLRIAKVEIVY